MSEADHLKIQSDPKHLAQGRRFIEHHARQAGFDDLTVSQIVLAVDEAVANIIRHSYDMKPDCDIEYKVTSSGENFIVALRDYGKPCDPAKIAPRPLHEIRPGGLGTHFIKTVMDEVKYCSRDPGTELILVKKRKPLKN
jgi:anti-sigma regulatory factor (Ser/Thr protein kinase)